MIIKQIIEENNLEGLDSSSDKIFKGFIENDGLHCITNLQCHNCFQNLAKYIVNTHKPKYILEFGSGAGDLSHFIRFFDENVIYVSVDINKKAALSPWYKGKNSHHFISRTDRPLLFVNENYETIIFDLIVSFEHFEHISIETFNIFLENFKRYMNKDTIVLCTTANTQCENVHINVKSSEDWNEYLTSKGFQMLDHRWLTVENQSFNMGIIEGWTKALSFKLQ